MAADALGARLTAVAARVLPALPVADLCCDHAGLAAALVGSGRVPRAIAGDIEAGPLAAARRTLDELGLAERVELREGDGLMVLDPGAWVEREHQRATRAIAGMIRGRADPSLLVAYRAYAQALSGWGS